jgi:threonine synthase
VTSRLNGLECGFCGRRYDAGAVQQGCDCGGPLFPRYDLAPLALAEVRERPPGMWRYRELLPVAGEPVSLGEHETPLVAAPRLSERFGVETLVKDESPLPGGTFKARGAAAGLSRARELGVKEVVMPSAGNAGGAWSLYAARAGIRATVTMARTAPAMNQAEVRAAGAELVLVDGDLADAGRRARAIHEESGAFLATTFSEPYRVDGKKAAFLEMFDALGSNDTMRGPATIVVPVGGGVAALAAAKACAEAAALGWLDGASPRLVGVQAQQCAPVVRAFERGDEHVAPWEEDPATIAAGMRVPRVPAGRLVLDAVRSSGGTMVAVSEEEILDAVRVLATSEGIFACPEGAATLAAADRLALAGVLVGPVVLYNTGSGAKYAAELTAAGL